MSTAPLLVGDVIPDPAVFLQPAVLYGGPCRLMQYDPGRCHSARADFRLSCCLLEWMRSRGVYRAAGCVGGEREKETTVQ